MMFADFGTRIALWDESGNKLSYTDLLTMGSSLAERIGHRCLAFILCTNAIGSVVGYTSFINHHIVPLLLNSAMDEELLRGLIDAYQPEYLWVPESQAADFPYAVEYTSCGYALLKTELPSPYPMADELALLLTTSGSTGSPKFVRQSYRNIESNARSIAEYLSLDETERPITTLPMNYTYGLSIINSHLIVGATVLLTEKAITQREFWSFFRQAEATSFGGVPFTYETLDRFRFYRMELPSLRYFTQAGGKLSVTLHQRFAEYAASAGKKFIVMYGQCEATARMGYLPAEYALSKVGSMGIVIPGGTFSLIDVNGDVITQPEVSGELVYRGENVTLGYAQSGKDLILGDERGGVLHTGDMAKRDVDGFYYIVGRKKRFLKLFGNRVNMDEAEQLVKSKFGNIDIAVSGVDDHMVLFVTDASLADKVRKFMIQKTGLNQSAFQAIVIGEIPKNDSGKTVYRELDHYFK